LSLRGEAAKYAGDDAMWAQAEELLRKALDDAGATYVEEPGEAAFYGPKIDVQIVDPAGRESTLSTIQIDFHQPERFDLLYVDSDGAKKRPVMVHRSIVGSMERLFAYLIEAHGGAFPVWYAPCKSLRSRSVRRRRTRPSRSAADASRPVCAPNGRSTDRWARVSVPRPAARSPTSRLSSALARRRRVRSRCGSAMAASCHRFPRLRRYG
jgi:hypothetical protein